MRRAHGGMSARRIAALFVLSAATAEGATVVAPRGPEQAALRVDATSELSARVCEDTACTQGAVSRVELPADLGGLEAATVESVGIGGGRHVVHVRVPAAGDASYHVLLAAPLAGAGQAPVVVHQGWSDRFSGTEGERRAEHVEVTPEHEGTRRVFVGELREDIDICGRPALLSTRMLDPQSLGLRAVRLQRLAATERSGAPMLEAKLVEEASSGALPMRARVASSAVGDPAAISDGDLETTWAEGRQGSGRGEFVTLLTSAAMPLRGFELVFRPPSGGDASGAAPKRFWLASRDALVAVDLPSDPWKVPGSRYRVELPTPWQTDCVALVLDSAYGSEPSLQVSVAELSALSDASELALSELVSRLGGADDEAAVAVAVLSARGPEASRAVDQAFADAPPGAQKRMLDVMDRVSCEQSAPTFARALTSTEPNLSERGQRGLRRCGDAAGAALEGALAAASPAAEGALAAELSLIDPARAIRVLTPRLDTPSRARRRQLRKALAQASSVSRAHPLVERTLESQVLSARARLDFLRALGSRSLEFQKAAETSFGRLATNDASFRVRYLLVEPAVTLAPVSPAAVRFLERSVSKDPSPLVRARAAAALGSTLPARFGPVRGALLVALRDANVRVRTAAAQSLGAAHIEAARDPLVSVLADDDWPLARTAAAEALAHLGASRAVDEALADALDEDPSRDVRARAARSLGTRKALEQREFLYEHLSMTDEDVEVRRASAWALGEMCDADAADRLERYALSLTEPRIDRDARALGLAALRALGKLAPADLAERLAPLQTKSTPSPVRRIVSEILAEPARCGGRVER